MEGTVFSIQMLLFHLFEHFRCPNTLSCKMFGEVTAYCILQENKKNSQPFTI